MTPQLNVESVRIGANSSVPIATTSQPAPTFRQPLGYAEYPKALYGPHGECQAVQNPDQEKVLMSRGWSETPAAVLLQQPATLAMQASTDTGLRESYALLKTQHDQNVKMFNERYGAKSMECDQLRYDLADLQKQFNDLSMKHATLAGDHQKLAAEHEKLKADSAPKVEEKKTPGVPFKKVEKAEVQETAAV